MCLLSHKEDDDDEYYCPYSIYTNLGDRGAYFRFGGGGGLKLTSAGGVNLKKNS